MRYKFQPRQCVLFLFSALSALFGAEVPYGTKLRLNSGAVPSAMKGFGHVVENSDWGAHQRR
jgi:hypothetical protein